jgi:hypothetical protein
MKFSITGQEKGDILIQVTSWASLIVYFINHVRVKTLTTANVITSWVQFVHLFSSWSIINLFSSCTVRRLFGICVSLIYGNIIFIPFFSLC